MSDEEEVRAAIAARVGAMRAGDAAGAVAVLGEDVRAFELGPPLGIEGAMARDVEGFAAWLAMWDGPPTVETADLRVEVDGDLAVAHGFMRIAGTMRNGRAVDLWHRSTLVLRRREGAWVIVHGHSSVPFVPDGKGGGRVLLDLRP